ICSTCSLVDHIQATRRLHRRILPPLLFTFVFRKLRILSFRLTTHLTTSSRVTMMLFLHIFFFQAEDGIRDRTVTGVQTCALPILSSTCRTSSTPSMKRGNSSNCVHWSYAVRTGTSRSIVCSIVVVMSTPSLFVILLD